MRWHLLKLAFWSLWYAIRGLPSPYKFINTGKIKWYGYRRTGNVAVDLSMEEATYKEPDHAIWEHPDHLKTTQYITPEEVDKEWNGKG